MTKCLAFFILTILSNPIQFQKGQFNLVQDEDGLIHFDFVDELGDVKSLPILSSDFALKSHIYDDQSQILAFATLSKSSSHSGFTGKSYSHLSLKFLKFNQSDYTFDFLYQKGFRFDKEISPENYNFNSIDKFQINGTGPKGFISFDLEKGMVSYMDGEELAVKEMVQMKTTINSISRSSTIDIPEKFSLSRANQSETLFK